MKRTVLRILVLAIAAMGCGITGGAAPHPHRVGSMPFSFAETVNIGTSATSSAQYVGADDNIGFAVTTTGTASGTWTIQYSNDGVNWDTYTTTTSPPAATGSPQTFGITLDFFEFAYVRIAFANTGGSGASSIKTQLKGL